MLTVLDQVSLAGDRTKQNDDAAGASGRFAWILDGATDLHTAPLSPGASDAAWFAHTMCAALHDAAWSAADDADLMHRAHASTKERWRTAAKPVEHAWQTPTASIVAVEETASGLRARDLGDSSLVVLDAAGAVTEFGGEPGSARRETADVRAVVGADAARPLDRAEVMDTLRARRAFANQPGGYWVLGLNPACLAAARTIDITAARPAHLLLATDGFAALWDRYEAYTAEGAIRAALAHGLAALAVELRAIEAADASGSAHPRWKKSDDATAVLLRLS